MVDLFLYFEVISVPSDNRPKAIEQSERATAGSGSIGTKGSGHLLRYILHITLKYISFA
jgi:hypothetical protein